MAFIPHLYFVHQHQVQTCLHKLSSLEVPVKPWSFSYIHGKIKSEIQYDWVVVLRCVSTFLCSFSPVQHVELLGLNQYQRNMSIVIQVPAWTVLTFSVTLRHKGNQRLFLSRTMVYGVWLRRVWYVYHCICNRVYQQSSIVCITIYGLLVYSGFCKSY